MKITAGVLCYNEEDLIWRAVDSIAPYVDDVIITDGTEIGSIGHQDIIDDVCVPSEDKTLKVIKYLAGIHDNVMGMHFHGLPILVQKDVRNIQMAGCDSGDWFLILDADEVWEEDSIIRAREFLRTCDADVVSVPNYNYFYNGKWHIKQKHRRFFRVRPNVEFSGNNEMPGKETELEFDSGIFYHHYGFVDPERVKERCKRFHTEYYHYCGLWWYENVYKAFNGENQDELKKENGGGLHLFSRRHPGYGNWHFYENENQHPEIMRSYVEKFQDNDPVERHARDSKA